MCSEASSSPPTPTSESRDHRRSHGHGERQRTKLLLLRRLRKTVVLRRARRRAILFIRYGLVGFLFDLTFVLNSAGLLMEHLVAYFCFDLGIRDFLSVPAKNIMQYWYNLQNPTRLVTGMAQGTSSLLSNTVYAISDAASQFSKAARKRNLQRMDMLTKAIVFLPGNRTLNFFQLTFLLLTSPA
ncbi:Putative vacuolar protein sorting-associated proteinC [Arachis hypogaea]|nr:Putative vacuolar protein sorting-associated proteinC [Arachis hypogaea]